MMSPTGNGFEIQRHSESKTEVLSCWNRQHSFALSGKQCASGRVNSDLRRRFPRFRDEIAVSPQNKD